ncbi:MAG: gamma-glutamyl-gamma-aminobutyrate hydrolase family protein, partial [Patescibacteria group bacterium]
AFAPDLIVLSGSSGFPVALDNSNALAAEIELIRSSTVPLIGICYGCELIAHAFGGTLADHGEGSREQDLVSIKVTKDDSIFGGRSEFEAYDAHRWVIADVPAEFEVLARSAHGPEVIRHKDRPLWGFQFHPEKMVDESYGDEVFNSLLFQCFAKD